MKERRLAREIAMQALFQWEAQGVLLKHCESPSQSLAALDIEGFLGHFIHLFYVSKNDKIDRQFAAEILRGTINSLHQIDSLLDNAGSKWKLHRMDAIDRAILRIACFELVIRKESSANIVINEAIEIAKRYGSEQSASFINGILDAINKKAI